MDAFESVNIRFGELRKTRATGGLSFCWLVVFLGVVGRGVGVGSGSGSGREGKGREGDGGELRGGGGFDR